MSALHPADTIRCQRCEGTGMKPNRGVSSVCPVCDGEGLITYKTVEEYARQIDASDRELVKLAKADYGARSHLGAALVQTLPTDDFIVMGHVRGAFVALGGKLDAEGRPAR